MLTIVVLKREGAGRAGFVVEADSVEEFERKLALAHVVKDATWKCYPQPEGTDPAIASRHTL